MSTCPPSGQRAPGLGGRHVLAAMLAFFGVIVVADATMIYQAVSTFGGVDNVNAYRDGLAYNARIASAGRQAALGWQDTVEIVPAPARLRITLKDAGGATPRELRGGALRIEATFGRPATNTSDNRLELAEVAPGVFEVPLGDHPAAGVWVATARVFASGAAAGEPVYQTRRRLWITP